MKLEYQPLNMYRFDSRLLPMKIDECNEEEKKAIIERLQVLWHELGEKEPYWSVLTADKFRSQNINDEALREFYAGGQGDADGIVGTMLRNGLIANPEEAKSMDIMEYGCGCGRVTVHLALRFRKVIAIDLSEGNLRAAKQASPPSGQIDFRQITKLEDYETLPMVDVVYSMIVLQHNPPVIIEHMLNSMLGHLNSGGMAYFQVPTFRAGYEFHFDSYMKNPLGIEMHVFPQKRIFELAQNHGCIPLEVYPWDVSGNPDDNSMLFVLKKQDKGL